MVTKITDSKRKKRRGQGYITYNSYTWNMPSSITLPGGTKKEYTYDPLMKTKSERGQVFTLALLFCKQIKNSDN